MNIQTASFSVSLSGMQFMASTVILTACLDVTEQKPAILVYCIQQQTPFYGPLSRTTQVSPCQKKHSPAHMYPYYQPSFISFLHLLRSIASSLFNLHAWQVFCTTFLQVLFGLPLGLEPSTSYSIHFFVQSLSSFRNTCQYHCNMFIFSTKIMYAAHMVRSKSTKKQNKWTKLSRT